MSTSDFLISSYLSRSLWTVPRPYRVVRSPGFGCRRADPGRRRASLAQVGRGGSPMICPGCPGPGDGLAKSSDGLILALPPRRHAHAPLLGEDEVRQHLRPAAEPEGGRTAHFATHGCCPARKRPATLQCTVGQRGRTPFRPSAAPPGSKPPAPANRPTARAAAASAASLG